MFEFCFVMARVYKFDNLQKIWISWNMLLSVAKDAYLDNCCKTTPYA